MDADTTKAASDSAHIWGQIGAFIGGILGLRGIQWMGSRRGNDVVEEIRHLRESIESHNAKLTELLVMVMSDVAILKDRGDHR